MDVSMDSVAHERLELTRAGDLSVTIDIVCETMWTCHYSLYDCYYGTT